MALADEVGLNRGLAADDEQVVGGQVRGDVETEGGEVAVVRPEQAPVEPDVGGEKSPADPQQHPAGMVGPGEGAAVPERLASRHGQPLAGHLRGFPAPAAAGRQAFGLALAERHPLRLPAVQAADPT